MTWKDFPLNVLFLRKVIKWNDFNGGIILILKGFESKQKDGITASVTGATCLFSLLPDKQEG